MTLSKQHIVLPGAAEIGKASLPVLASLHLPPLPLSGKHTLMLSHTHTHTVFTHTREHVHTHTHAHPLSSCSQKPR